MKLLQWDFDAWEDYLYFIKDIERHPFEGIGKPEPLKGNLTGLWSRRIDEEHRIVYLVEGDNILIFACRGHYNS